MTEHLTDPPATDRDASQDEGPDDESMSGRVSRRASRAIHDFNNLLVGVLGNARLALLDLAPDNPARAHVEAIKSAAERAAGLARQIFKSPGRQAADSSAQTRATPDPPAAQSTGIDARPPMVLLIDDQAEVRRSVGDLLERSGYAVAPARNGEEGLRAFREHGDDVDVVLLDLTLPGLSGADVFEKIRAVRPGLPVVLASGYGETLDDPRLVGQPRTTYLAKPFRFASLTETLRQLLEA